VAQVESFHYAYGKSFFHTLDERLKILLVLAYCTIATTVRPFGLAPLAIALLFVIIVTRFRFVELIRELAGFYVFLLLVWILNAYSVPGKAVIDFIVPLPSREGIFSGLLLVSRLVLVLFAGALFSGTTLQTRLVSAVHSILRRIPFVPASLVATMMGLAIMFVPLLLDTFGEISDALRSRCIDRMRNPVRKIVSYAMPLFAHLFIHAGELAEAMESRCYTGEYTMPVFKIKAGDIVVFLCGIAVCTASVFLGISLN
jgi:energy-coupling factor transport system permease protein